MKLRSLVPASMAACCIAGPALADSATLRALASGAVGADQPLLRPLAACLLGGGEVDPVADALAEAGFGRESYADMGVTYLTAPGAAYYVSLYMNGAICDVSSEEIGTDMALMQLMVLGGLLGFEMLDGDCMGLRVGGVEALVTSTGNDPVCFDDATSTVRFSFDAAN